MTQSRPPEDTSLDAELAGMRATPPAVPDGLMARVTSDALAELPTAKSVPFWKQFLSTLGGWPAVAALAATACVGVWTGGTYSADLMMTFGYEDSASLAVGGGLGAFDLLLVDG